MESVHHKLTPQSLEAEQAILGAILLDNPSLLKVVEFIEPTHFYKDSHRKIYQAMLAMFEKNEPVDLLTLSDHLRKKNLLEDLGGVTYLTQLMQSVVTAANIRHYAKIVREKYILRNVINVTTEIAAEAYEFTEDVDQLLDRAEQKIFDISQHKIQPIFVNIDRLIKDTIKHIETLYSRKELITGLPTGFIDFDQKTAGLQPSDLIIIAGRPSMGKTAFCLNISQYVATEIKQPVAIFSLEMSKEQLAIRMLCSQGRIDGSKLRTGYLSKSDWDKLTYAAGVLSDSPIFIDDSPGLTVLDIRARARRLQSEHGLSLIIIDYLQLIGNRYGRSENRQQEISEITRSLKGLAKELNVPVIALSQLSRAVEQRQDRRPQLSDLRESGAIEQDGDVIAFLYRDEVYNKNSQDVGTAELIISKQRNGPIGTVKLTFLKEFTHFDNFSQRLDDF